MNLVRLKDGLLLSFAVTTLLAVTACSSASSGEIAPDAGEDTGGLIFVLPLRDAGKKGGGGDASTHTDAHVIGMHDAMGVSPIDGASDGQTAVDGEGPDAADAGFDVFEGPDCGTCTGNQTCCGVCTDTTSDPENCGNCYTECGQGAVCDDSQCALTVCTGQATENEPCLVSAGNHGVCCGDTCVATSLTTDPNNCGRCGIVCPNGATCAGSACLTADGGTPTCSAGSGCPSGDLCCPAYTCSTSPVCLSPTCGAGSDGNGCGIAGDPSLGTCCNGACDDFTSDNHNCGTCGNVCSGSQFCYEGTCTTVPSCATSVGGTACPLAGGVIGSCCDGSCIDVSNDSASCGQCGRECPVGSTCNGSGECTAGDAGMVTCSGAGGCPSGSLCYGSVYCLPTSCGAGDDGSACSFGPTAQGTCCGGACVNTAEDPHNCGTCGTSCASGVCGGGFGLPQCLPAPSQGGCEFGCLGGTTCAGGQCVPAACMGPFGTCAAEDGNIGACCYSGGFEFACSDVSTDASNCGGCGFACPTGQTCTAGVCSGTAAPCGAGTVGEYCDLAEGTNKLCCAGTGCIDVTTSAQDCGACGNTCQPGFECVTGSCVTATCSASNQQYPCLYQGAAVPGAECCGTTCVDTNTSTSNCGGCGMGCAGSETCVAGYCGVPSCTAQTVGDPCHLTDGPGLCCAAGCVDTTSDNANCGGCGLPCGAGQTCTNGSCN